MSFLFIYVEEYVKTDILSTTFTTNTELTKTLDNFIKKNNIPSSALKLSEKNVEDLIPKLTDFLKMSTTGGPFMHNNNTVALAMDIADVFNLKSYKDLKLKSRIKDIVVARQLFFTILYHSKYGSLNHIAQALNINKDHATVVHSIKTIANLIDTEDTRYYDKLYHIVKRYGYLHKYNKE